MIDGAPLLRLARLGRARRPADLYDAWLFAAADAKLALAAWRLALSRDRSDAYAVYVAALDREEQAAARLQLCLLGAA